MADYSDVVRVIDVADVTHGALLNIDMDGDAQNALGYVIG